jgi:hypothetical protein
MTRSANDQQRHPHASGEPYAYIDWSDAITALGTGDIHGSGSENNILRIAASLGDPGIPVQIACVLGNLDRTNIGLVAAAIFRVNSSGTGPASNPVPVQEAEERG